MKIKKMAEKILIAGGSGLIGKRLTTLLKEEGYEVAWLSRSKQNSGEVKSYYWNPDKNEIDDVAVKNSDYIINLAGAGIADKLWTPSRKKLLIDSRTIPTDLLITTLKNSENNVKGYFSASAIGFYGERGDQLLNEFEQPGKGFLAESTIAWENAIAKASSTKVRWAAFRISVVVSKNGGALPKLLIPFLFRVGGYFGSGAQWYSWIHIDDVCRIFIYAIKNENIKGFYNAASPNNVTNLEFTKAVGEAKGGSFLYIPAPVFLLKLAMGEMSSVILNSTRVSSEKIESTGFKFNFPEIVGAINDVLNRGI